jgi:hypothetical protein
MAKGMVKGNEKISVSNNPPRFFSFAFHTHFFPSLLWRRLRPKKQEYQSPFSNHIPMEFTILTILSMTAGVAGLVAGFGRGSIIGWGLGGLGVAGFLALLIGSIRSEMGNRPEDVGVGGELLEDVLKAGE